jgi:3-oxoacyl-[acyl-carrier-protein] synthase I
MDIVATGMVCSVGLTAASACAAIRAKVAGFHELPYLDLYGEEVVGSAAPDLGSDFEDPDRLVELACLAIENCAPDLAALAKRRLPLLLGLSEPGRPGGVADPNALLGAIEARLGVKFHPDDTRLVPGGHVAGVEAMRLARELLRSGAPACLVAAVDSYANAASLGWLERSGRLKSFHNSDGVIPGEAAAAVLVRSRPSDVSGAAAKVCGLGFAHEAAGVLSDEPMLGLGLARAARAALEDAGLEMGDVDFRLSDVTGESYGFREQALAVARLLKERRECLPIWHCADAIGDTGAAAALCQFVVAADAYRKRYAPGRRALCYASAVAGGRAAAVLERWPLATSDQARPPAAGSPARGLDRSA